jgi:hypothetical protein
MYVYVDMYACMHTINIVCTSKNYVYISISVR